jgi:hypothetical protein
VSWDKKLAEFSTAVFLEPLLSDASFAVKKMFGGLAVYYDSRLVLVLTESPGDRAWAGKRFTFDLWNGVLLCTDYSLHNALQTEFNALTGHPVLKKWLYLPATSPDFEDQFEKIVRCIKKKDGRIGVAPSVRKRARKGAKRKQQNKKVPK